MKMKVQEFIEQNGLAKLSEAPYFISIKDYPDRAIVNYDQIESPKFDPMVMECRALILWKNNWSVAARAFDRFFNAGEQIDAPPFPFNASSRFEEKVDGSIILLYWDWKENRWQPASRSCAFAEGETLLGNTFGHVFWKATENTRIMEYLNALPDLRRNFTWIFELVSPETRVVKNYPDYQVFLTGCRHNESGIEMTGAFLDNAAQVMEVSRPKSYTFKNLQDAIEQANALPTLDEGFVLVSEADPNHFFRLKVKNVKYLAIAHLVGNGQVSAHRLLTLIMANEQAELLSYFPEYKKYIDFVEDEYLQLINRVRHIWELHQNQPTQKDYALAIIPLCKNDLEKGLLFELRKGKKTFDELIKGLEAKKSAKAMNLKVKLQKAFAIVLENDEEI